MKHLVYVLVTLMWSCQAFRDQPFPDPKAQTNLLTVDTTGFHTYGLSSKASVKEFYHKHGYALHWLLSGLLTSSGDSLMRFVAEADMHGLIANDYHLAELQRLLRDTLATERLPKIDILLTDAYLTLYSHLRYGRLDPKTLERKNFSRLVDTEAIGSLEKIQQTFLTQQLLLLEPRTQQYGDLKRLLPGFAEAGKSDTVQMERAFKIALNMERWRWQKKPHDRYIAVNIPAFMLRVVENDSLWLETKVIVGKRGTPTPVMESLIRSFIIYPYWHVPYSISTKEILPDLQKDATYLRRNNFDVLDRDGQVILPDTIQWAFYSPEYFPFILRQREGSENSMGIIKFVFANNYNVYLHDTNSKRLFSRVRRDLSHGCVRVSNAVALARYLVREDDIYVSPEDLDQYLSLQQRLTIELRKPIPLRLEYFTAEVRQGVPFFYEDIYKKDSVMMRALYPPESKDLLVATPVGL